MLRVLENGERHVAGGTAWLWAREDMEAAVDVLVVDEAGQMTLANVAAAGRGARNLVLLGDPQQLEQPLKGSHPETTAVSVLQHVLGSAKTIASDRGLFLAETWRLSPAICRFTSELFYDGRLTSRAGLERQRLVGPVPFAGSGLWYAPVEHTGNQNQSIEEAEIVAGLYQRLLNEYQWVDQDGRQKPITSSDILIVAPYNSQVFAIQSRLPAAPGRHRRSVSRTGGGGRHLFGGHIVARGSAARDGVPLQPQSAERRDIACPMRGDPGCQPAAVRAGLPDTASDAARERVVPVSGDGRGARPKHCDMSSPAAPGYS